MIKVIKDLIQNKNTPKGRVAMVMFIINISIFLYHIVLMHFYARYKILSLIIYNSITTSMYFCFAFFPSERTRLIGAIAFIEIWVHMIGAVLTFGWAPGFQNWAFGLTCAFFLPSFSPTQTRVAKKDNRPWILGIFFMITFFVLRYVTIKYNLPKVNYLNLRAIEILFIFNSFLSFAAIFLFTKFFSDRTSIRERELSRKADFDELTEVYNRRALNQIGADTIMKSIVTKKDFSVAICDIDHFKVVNDTFGHISGDMVLKELASLLRSFAIRGITVGRWGGEEFVMIAPPDMQYAEFTHLLEKFRKQVANHRFELENKRKKRITISIGSASISDVQTLDEAILIADRNLYVAKESGRNRLIK
jgi:diguanylate cyclase (GGDEF)-like protein